MTDQIPTDRGIDKERLVAIPREIARLCEPVWPDGEGRYPVGAFLALATFMGLTRMSAHLSAVTYGALTGDDDSVPTAGALRHFPYGFEPEDIKRLLNESFGALLDETERVQALEGPVDVVVQTHFTEYRGHYLDCDWLWETHRYEEVGSEYGLRFASLTTVGKPNRVCLAVVPVKQGMASGEIIGELLDEAIKHVTIGTVYADPEFAQGCVVKALDERSVDYAIPVPRNRRVNSLVKEMKMRVGTAAQDVKVVEEYAITPLRDAAESYEYVYTNLTIVRSEEAVGGFVPFYTNKKFAGSSTDGCGQTVERVTQLWNRRSWKNGFESDHECEP